MPRLGVNVDHVATLRQARRGSVPSPAWAARVAEAAGCDSIVCHLREDRRHIQEGDLWELKTRVRTSLNLEMAAIPKILKIAAQVKPDQATLVPERRRELTTEGGLDLSRGRAWIRDVIRQLQSAGIRVSLFIDPDPPQIECAALLGVPMVELHTGQYAQARTRARRLRRLSQLKEGSRVARSLGLLVAAGHGLDYQNAPAVARIGEIIELNIGFSIVSRALFVGLDEAVRDMRRLIAR